jgi:hypothetical protein
VLVYSFFFFEFSLLLFFRFARFLFPGLSPPRWHPVRLCLADLF